MPNIDQMDRFAEPIARVHLDKGSIAFVPVMHDNEGDYGPGLGVAVEGERGFYPVPKFYYTSDDYEAAGARADQLNRDTLHLSTERAIDITLSSMAGV